jgi:hypothetical protein
MAKAQLLPPSEVSSEERLESLLSGIARLSKELASLGVQNTSGAMWLTPENTFPATKCPSPAWLENWRGLISSLTWNQSHDQIKSII